MQTQKPAAGTKPAASTFHVVSWSLKTYDRPYDKVECELVKQRIQELINQFSPLCICLRDVSRLMMNYLISFSGYLIMFETQEECLVTLYRLDGLISRTKLFSGLTPFHKFEYKDAGTIVNVGHGEDKEILNSAVRSAVGKDVSDFILCGDFLSIFPEESDFSCDFDMTSGDVFERKLVRSESIRDESFSFYCICFNKTTH